jgi:MFS family permease
MITRVLKNPDFTKIWLAQITSQIATNLINFALLIQVYELAKNTPYANVAVSILVLSFGIPSIIFALLAGAYVDHLDRKKVLIITNVLRAVLVLGFVIFNQNLIAIYIIVFLISTLSQFFTPAEAAALPRLVEKKQLLPANSLFLLTLYSSFILGYSLAGPLISVGTIQLVYWVTAICFVLAAVLSMRLPTMHATKPGLNFRAVNHQVFLTIRSTTAKIFRSPQLIFPITNLTIGQMMIGVFAVVAPALAILLFNQSLADVSVYMIIPAAVGMVLGAVAVSQFLKDAKKVVLINVGVLIAVLALLSFGVVTMLQGTVVFSSVITIISFMLGLANALVGVSAQTLLQVHSKDDERGKIFGTLNMMMNLGAMLPVLLAGVTADLISPTWVLFAAGVLIALYGIYQFFTLRKHEKLFAEA